MTKYGNFTWKPEVTAKYLEEEKLPQLVNSDNCPIIMTAATTTANSTMVDVMATGMSGQQYKLCFNGNWVPVNVNLDIHVTKDGVTITSSNICSLCNKEFNEKIEGFKEHKCDSIMDLDSFLGYRFHEMCYKAWTNCGWENKTPRQAFDELHSKILNDPYYFNREIVEKSQHFLGWQNRATKKQSPQSTSLCSKIKKPSNEQRLILTSDLRG